MKQEIVITHPSEIRGLAKDVGFFGNPAKTIKVELPANSSEENEKLEQEIMRHYSACGCSQGKITGIATLVIYLLLVLTGILSVSKIGFWNVVWLYLACSFATMLVGKLYGLWRARRELLRLSARM